MDPNNRKPNTPGGDFGLNMMDWRTEMPHNLQQGIIKERNRLESLKRHHPSSSQEGSQERKKAVLECTDKIYAVATSEVEDLSKAYAVYSKEHETTRMAVAMLQDKMQTLESALAGMKQQLSDVLGKKPAESIIFQQIEPHQIGPGSSSMLPLLLSSMHQGTSLGQSLSLQSQPYFAPLKDPLSQQHHGATNLLVTEWQHPLSLPANQQMQSENQLSQQFLQQHDTLLHNMHQILQALGQAELGPLQQLHNVIYQQKQLCQFPGVDPGTSSQSLNFTAVAEQDDGFGWQEVANQRIEAMEMTYLHKLNEMHQMLVSQQTDSPLQQFNPECFQKMHSFNDVLGQTPTSWQNPQDNGLPGFREKLDISKEMMNIINIHRKYVLSQQQGRGLKHHLQSRQQQQCQIPEVHSFEYQLNPQRPTTNFQGSAPIGQLRNSEVSLSSFSGVSPLWQNLTHPLHHGSNFDPGQGNSISSPHQLGVGLQYLYTLNFPQQININPFSSPSRVNVPCPYDSASKFQGISTLPSERAAGTAASADRMAQTMVSRALLSAGTTAESVDTATTTTVAAIKLSSKAAVGQKDVSDRYPNGLKII